MLVSYPVLFYLETSEDYASGFSVFFPDFPEMSGTSGSDIPEALENASDYLDIFLAAEIAEDRTLPNPSLISSLSLLENNPIKSGSEFTLEYDAEKSFISMVSVDLTEYLGSEEPIKKTVMIPKWADKLGEEMHLSFSKTLTEAIVREKLGA
ncbi:type II toxin-antitoxin system HicB family antitoxin [Enterococcus mundtii]|uniref:type II toxin-antitoxin system HicB family antitoxin n=1 Tax=Enterococcus TaxID=1350 RepID=UPI000F7CF36F|nr:MULTISPECIES: type II toxin-antitoxin system HicB family antitoxin [Enterococcus]AZP92128.1 hypothetical protein CYK55_02895 [Enterococcus mundtii]MDK4211814.1 type II toxin-antitoxin system HicB family antitoxin [Enterococcus mundtii]